MKKTLVIIPLVLMVLFLPYSSVSANDGGVIIDEENVMISLTNTDLQVIEEIKITNIGTKNVSSLRFWVQQNIQDAVKITEKQSGKELIPLITGNIRTCNLSTANLSIIPDGTLWLKEKGYQGSVIMGPKQLLRLAFYADGKFVEMPNSCEKLIESLRENGVRIVAIESCTIDQDCPGFLANSPQAGLLPLGGPVGKKKECPIQMYVAK